MAIETIGIIDSPMKVAAINTTWSTSVTHNIPSSDVWVRTQLTDVFVYDTDSGANARVVQLIENGVTKNVNWIGHFGQNVTKVIYRLTVYDAWARAHAITQIFA